MRKISNETLAKKIYGCREERWKNQHILFFSCITAMVGKKKAKARRRRNDSGSNEEDGEEYSNNNCGISFWIVFNWPEYGISSFAEHISKNFWRQSLIWCLAKPYGHEVSWKWFIYCRDRNFYSTFYSNIFAVHSSKFHFLIFFRKLEQIATRCH